MYSSPEQIRGEKLRLNTDLWSFGAIAFEVLTGEQLFQVDGYTSASAEWQNQMTQKILKADIGDKLKELPEKWRNTLLQCLQREHEQRVKSTDEIKDILLGLSASDINVTPEPKKVNPVNNDVTQVNPKTKDKDEYKPKKPTSSVAGTKPKPKEEKKWPYALVLGAIVVAVAGFGIWNFIGNPDQDNINENQISLFQQDGLYGYKIGDSTVIASNYKLAENFIDGRAKVSTKDSTFYIDQAGEWAGSFIMEDKSKIVDNEEIVQIEDNPDDAPVTEDENEKPIEEESKLEKADSVEELKPDNSEKPTIDWRSNYDYIDSFERGLARVGKNKKYGLINKNHELIVPLIYDYIDRFTYPTLRVKLKNKVGLIDKTGKIVLPIEYDRVDDLYSHHREISQNGKVGLWSPGYGIYVPIEFDDVWVENPTKFVSARVGSRNNGKTVLFESGKQITRFFEKIITKNGKIFGTLNGVEMQIGQVEKKNIDKGNVRVVTTTKIIFDEYKPN